MDHQDTPALEAHNLLFLCLLYSCQGLPMGLIFGSLPLLLQSKMTYAGLAIFSLASYPYTFKLLWSPLVDSIFIKSVGRRRSWVIPTQLASAVAFLALGSLWSSGSDRSADPVFLSAVFMSVMTLAATQDIAVDAWALTMLDERNVGLAATCQSVGMTTGYYASYTLFLSLNSPEFCERWLGMTGGQVAVTLPGWFVIVATVYLTATALTVIKAEAEEPGAADSPSIREAYADMLSLLKLEGVRGILPLTLLGRVPFSAYEAAYTVMLVKRGFKKEELAMLALVQFPLELLFSVLAGRYSRGSTPLRPFFRAYQARLALAVAGATMAYLIPRNPDQPGYLYALVLLVSLASSLSSSFMMVSQGGFFNRVADPALGGTYVTFLNSLVNAGNAWPRFMVLTLMGWMTSAPCTAPGLSCETEERAALCRSAGATCLEGSEGYFPVAALCALWGLLFVAWAGKRYEALQHLPPSAWKIEKMRRRGGGGVV